MNTKAIVLLSGGQDSTTCLYWAKSLFKEIHAVSFNYGQKHAIELDFALKICNKASVKFNIFNVKDILGNSSLVSHTRDHNLPHANNKDLPASFTAGRNALFLTIAASYGFNEGIRDIVTGVCQTDYSGYPDCRQRFITSMEQSLSFAMFPQYNGEESEEPDFEAGFKIHTPLMHLTKAETFKLAKDLGCLEVIINDTITDYNGDTTKNEWGMGINNNPATALRVKGYYEAKELGYI